MAISAADLLAAHGMIKAEDIDAAAKADDSGFADRLEEGYHENCTISEISVWETQDGSAVYDKDPTWTRLKIKFTTENGEFVKMFGWPSTKILYGEKGTAAMYQQIKTLINAAHRVCLNKDVALSVFSILKAHDEFLIGSKVNLRLGFKKTSHVKKVDKGVFELVEYEANKKRYVTHDISFKDFAEAKAYAEQNCIELGYLDLLSIDPCSSEYVIDPVMLEVYTALGVIDGGDAPESPVAANAPAAPVEKAIPDAEVVVTPPVTVRAPVVAKAPAAPAQPAKLGLTFDSSAKPKNGKLF